MSEIRLTLNPYSCHVYLCAYYLKIMSAHIRVNCLRRWLFRFQSGRYDHICYVLIAIIFHYEAYINALLAHNLVINHFSRKKKILLTRISGLNNYTRVRLSPGRPWDFSITLFRSFHAYNYFSQVRGKFNIGTLNATFSPLTLRLIIDILELLCGESLAQLSITSQWSRSYGLHANGLQCARAESRISS